MKIGWLVAALVPIAFAPALGREYAWASPPATEPIGYRKAAKLLPPIPGVKILADGRLEADQKTWKRESDSDGTEILTSKKPPESRIAALRTGDGSIEALAVYVLQPAGDQPSENSSSLFFTQGRLKAITACEATGATHSAIGRICVTATPRLCVDLRTGKGLDAEAVREMEAFEMRALASILTLRGSEHQLDNVVRSGNRLGLNSSLQTTKGQLMALARQIQKETGGTSGTVKSESEVFDPVTTKKVAERARLDALNAKSVLEKSLPRLKQACKDGGF